MTREEQLQQFAEQYTKGLHLDRHNLIQMVKAGAKWADQHPNWIPVEERFPESHFADTSSGWVLVCTTKGGIFIDSYNHKHNEWCNNRTSVTHWMPLPQPPRKE